MRHSLDHCKLTRSFMANLTHWDVSPNLKACFRAEMESSSQPVSIGMAYDAMMKHGLVERLSLHDDESIYSEIEDMLAWLGRDCPAARFLTLNLE